MSRLHMLDDTHILNLNNTVSRLLQFGEQKQLASQIERKKLLELCPLTYLKYTSPYTMKTVLRKTGDQIDAILLQRLIQKNFKMKQNENALTLNKVLKNQALKIMLSETIFRSIYNKQPNEMKEDEIESFMNVANLKRILKTTSLNKQLDAQILNTLKRFVRKKILIKNLPNQCNRKLVTNLWTSPDNRTPRILNFMSNLLSINQNYALISRKTPKSFWQKFRDFKNSGPRETVEFHLSMLQKIISPFKTIKGLHNLKNILGRYAGRFKFQEIENS